MARALTEMIIVDQYGNNKRVDLTNGPTVIPRIGEAVNWRYDPAPRVVNVQYNYDDGEVYVALG